MLSCYDQSKMVRADAISEQRTAILQEMARIKKSMAEQEEKMKQVIGLVGWVPGGGCMVGQHDDR